jgi:hypothetical protein
MQLRQLLLATAGASYSRQGMCAAVAQAKLIHTMLHYLLNQNITGQVHTTPCPHGLLLPGMACKTPDGERILPRVSQADAEALAQRAADQLTLVNSLMAGTQLQGVATQQQGLSAGQIGNAQQQQHITQAGGLAQVQEDAPQRPAAVIGQTGQSLTGSGLSGGQVLDTAAMQQALGAALQQQALKQLQPGLAAVSGTKKAA